MTLSRTLRRCALAGILLSVSVTTVWAEDYDRGEKAAERPAPVRAAPPVPQTDAADFERFAAGVAADASTIGGTYDRAPVRAVSSPPQTDVSDFERFAAKVGVDPSAIGDELARTDAPDPLGAEMIEKMFCPLCLRMEPLQGPSFSSGAWQRAPFDPLALPADPPPIKVRLPASVPLETLGAGTF